MYKTKSELDKHIGRLFLKCKTSTERNRESFKIARLYFDIHEYESASRLLDDYLAEFTLDPFAWKLKGEIYELSEQNWTSALRCYSESYNLSQDDPKILLKVINCYINIIKMNQKFDAKKAREWLFKAEKLFKYDTKIVELKEKLFDSIDYGASTNEISDWENYLIRALNENYQSEDLHIKLVKLYLKQNSIIKAMNHIIKLEIKCLFSNINWYQTLLDLIEQKTIEIALKSQDNEKKPLNNQQDNQLLLKNINLILLHHYILNILKTKSENNILVPLETLIHKFDSCLHELKIAMSINNKQLNDIFIREYHSQYYFLMGLFLIKVFKRDYASGLDQDMINLKSCYLEANVCFAKSSLISKPNPQQSAPITNNSQDFASNLTKLINRESNWRYSIIGNWFKYIQSSRLYTNVDHISFVKQIIDHGNESGINLSLKIQRLVVEAKLKMFEFNENDFNLKLLEQNQSLNKFHFIHNSALEYADKQCLAGQSSNLNYLVWYNLVNVKKAGIDLMAMSSNDQVFPYFYFRSFDSNLKKPSNDLVRYGIENLNICNLDSLCLIDMKVFLYMTSFQTLSKKRDYILDPYWLENSLSTKYQSDWWSSCFNYLFGRHLEYFEIETPIESLSSVKQNDLMKILELIRLKTSSIKLQSNQQDKYKPNIKLCIRIAKFLQYLLDNLKTSSSNIEINYSPKEKYYYLRKYALTYWSYVCKQLIKLKQLENLNEEGADLSFKSFTNSPNITSISRRKSEVFNNLNDSVSYRNYFDFITEEYEQDFDNKENTNDSIRSDDFINEQYDNIIQTGILYLIINYIHSQDEDCITIDESNLNESINLFHLMETSLSEKSKNELNFFHLQQLKKVGEILVAKRDEFIDQIRLNYEDESLKRKLDKILVLIEFIKKKISLGFNTIKTPTTGRRISRITKESGETYLKQSDKSNVNYLNQSITESIKDMDNFIKERLNNEFVKEKIQNLSLSEKQQPIIEEEEEEEEDKEEQKELEDNQSKSEPINQEQQFQIVEIKPKDEEELLKIKEQLIEQEKIKIRLEIENEMRQKSVETDFKYQQEQNKKTLSLIELLNKQKNQYLSMQSDFLREQFDLIKCQFKQINNEISQLNKIASKRTHQMIDFYKLTSDFSHLCDANMFNTQFNVFYWLFQSQPAFGQYFLNFNSHLDISKQIDTTFKQEEHLQQEMDQDQDPIDQNEQSTQQEFNQSKHFYSHNVNNINDEATINSYKTPDLTTQSISQKSDIEQKPANQTPKIILDKPICDLKFPSNLNLIDKLKESCQTYNKSLNDDGESETSENNQDQEERFYDQDEQESNVLSQTRQETFLSCNSHLNETSNNSNSLNELEIIFDQNGLFYDLNKTKMNEWCLIGKCSLQLIVDGSSKTKYRASIMCYLLDEKKTITFEIDECFKFNNVRNSSRSIYWWNGQNRLNGLIEFDNEDTLNEFRSILAETKSKYQQINKVESPQKMTLNQWQPPDIIPNKSTVLLDRQITFIINENFEYPSVNLNISKLNNEPSMENLYLATISNNDGKDVLFKHYFNKNTKFEVSENPKRYQFICKYNLKLDATNDTCDEYNHQIVDNIFSTCNNIKKQFSSYNVNLVFSSKPTQVEFLNLFN